MLINGQIFQEFHSLTNVSFLLNDSVAVSRPQNNSFLVAFPSEISVTVTEIQDSLSIVFAAPSSFQGQTKGLLGLWNGDQQYDFLKPDGTILPSNATGRQIHFNFGLEYKFHFGLRRTFIAESAQFRTVKSTCQYGIFSHLLFWHFDQKGIFIQIRSKAPCSQFIHVYGT